MNNLFFYVDKVQDRMLFCRQKAMQSKREEMMRKSMTGVNIPPGFTLPQPLSHSQKSPPGYKAAAGHHTSSKMIQVPICFIP